MNTREIKEETQELFLHMKSNGVSHDAAMKAAATIMQSVIIADKLDKIADNLYRIG